MSAGPATLTNIQRGELTAAGWTQVHTYQVITTDGTDGPDVVIGAADLPSFGSALAYDPLARVSRITPTKVNDGSTIHWEVDVEYSRETGNQEDHQQPPTLRPVKRAATTRWVERALMRDKNGIAILTSAGTPFNPPITIQVPHPVVTFQRWEDTFTTDIKKAFEGKINSDTFGAYEPGWVMCTKIDADEQWEQDAEGEPKKYWLVTYEFEACYDENDTFDPFRVLNADYWFIDVVTNWSSSLCRKNDGKRKPIYVDKNGLYHGDPDCRDGATPVPSPVPLVGSPAGQPDFQPADYGRVLDADELPDAANFLELNIYGDADFNLLELPVDQT